MNKQNDFVYFAILKGALAEGATERIAKDEAMLGLENFKKGKFDKAINLINNRIAEAKKRAKYDISTSGRNDKQGTNKARSRHR